MAIQSKRKSLKKASVKKRGKSHSRTQKKKGGKFLGFRGVYACPEAPDIINQNESDLKKHMICKIGKVIRGKETKLDDLDELQKKWLNPDQYKKVYAKELETVINDSNTDHMDKSSLKEKLKQLEQPEPEETEEEPEPEPEPEPRQKPNFRRKGKEPEISLEGCNRDIKNLINGINPCKGKKNDDKRIIYKEKRLKVHPDKNKECKEATKAFQYFQNFCNPQEENKEAAASAAEEEEEKEASKRDAERRAKWAKEEKDREIREAQYRRAAEEEEKEASKRDEEINNKMEKIKKCEEKHKKNGILNDEEFQKCVECDSDDDCDDEPSKGGKKRSSKKQKKRSKKGSRKSKK